MRKGIWAGGPRLGVDFRLAPGADLRQEPKGAGEGGRGPTVGD